MHTTPVKTHDPLPSCDCHACALVERDRLRLQLHNEKPAAAPAINHLVSAIAVLRKVDCGGWLRSGSAGEAKRAELMRCIDAVYRASQQLPGAPATTTRDDGLAAGAESALVEDSDDLPTFTDPLQALEFLAGRMEYAGVAEAVARAYAKELRQLLAAQWCGQRLRLSPMTATKSTSEPNLSLSAGAVITEMMLGTLIHEALNEGINIEVMNRDLQKRTAKLSAAQSEILGRFIKQVAPADGAMHLGNCDMDLAKVAIGFVDRAGDPCRSCDPAERICAEFYTAVTTVLNRHRPA